MNGPVVLKLKDKKYRDAYVLEHIKTGVPYQIQAVRKQRGWTQKELGIRADKPQTVISRLENTEYGNLNLRSLIEMASAFDVALLVKFVPFSRFVSEFENVSMDNLGASSFEEEVGAMEPSHHNVAAPTKVINQKVDVESNLEEMFRLQIESTDDLEEANA